MNQSIFKAYDVRGVYPQEFDEEAAYRIARATAIFLEGKTMLIAMDERHSSITIKEAVIEGLEDGGVAKVIDIGAATTPMFYFASYDAGVDGGIMVTASHNPPQYNGLKIVGKEAMPIGEESGLPEIKEKVLTATDWDVRPPRVPSSFIVRKVEYLSRYADFLSRNHSVPQMRVVVDAACGVAGSVVSAVAKNMKDLDIIPLCFAPCKTMTHGADPTKEENVRDLMDAIVREKADCGVAFDGDGDRAFFFDREGKRIPSHAIASLVAKHMLEKYPGSTIIADVRMPKVFEETVRTHGGRPKESRVGHSFIKKIMRAENAAFGAEVSGHFYFRDFYGLDSGAFMMMEVFDICARTGKTIEELTASFCVRHQSGELNFTVADKSAAIKKIKEAFADAELSELDGLSVKYGDWWCNVRPSNTEPYLRVNIEADTLEALTEVRKKIESIITS